MSGGDHETESGLIGGGQVLDVPQGGVRADDQSGFGVRGDHLEAVGDC